MYAISLLNRIIIDAFIKNIYWLLNVDTNILPKRRLASRPSSFATHKPYLCVTECSQMSILNAAWPRATKLQIYFTIYQIFKIYFRIKNFRNKSRKSIFNVSTTHTKIIFILQTTEIPLSHLWVQMSYKK